MKHAIAFFILNSSFVIWNACLASVPKPMPYTVPEEKRIRVIMSMDTANEIDDAFAIVHCLLTPQFEMKGIVSALFRENDSNRGKSQALSHQETLKVLETTGFTGKVPAVRGAVQTLENEATPRDSEGARFIIAEAMKDDPRPLFVVCGGALTDVASAILLEPAITNRMTVTWSGGGSYASGKASEYNLDNDRKAANVVFSSCVPMWQFPSDVYSQVRTTSAELAVGVWRYGDFGKYQHDAMMAYNEKCKYIRWPRGEDWTNGDAPAVSALLDQTAKTDRFEMREAPRVDVKSGRYIFETGNRPIRVYTKVDGRVIMSDLFAKMKLAYGD